MNIRPATIDDVEPLFVMMEEFYAHGGLRWDPTAARAALETLLRDRNHGVVLLMEEVDGRAAGYAVLVLGYSLEFHGRDAFLDELYVREEHRGRGHGTQAIEALIPVARDLGVKALHLEADHENPRAHELYRRLGFEDHPRWLMTKRL